MDMNDPIEARRRAEHWLVQDAYDYALAKLGYTRSNAELTGPYCLDDAKIIVENAQAKLLRSAEALAAALVVDARVMPSREVDRRLRLNANKPVTEHEDPTP